MFFVCADDFMCTLFRTACRATYGAHAHRRLYISARWGSRVARYIECAASLCHGRFREYGGDHEPFHGNQQSHDSAQGNTSTPVDNLENPVLFRGKYRHFTVHSGTQGRGSGHWNVQLEKHHGCSETGPHHYADTRMVGSHRVCQGHIVQTNHLSTVDTL